MCKNPTCSNPKSKSGEYENAIPAGKHAGKPDKKSGDKLEAISRQLDDINVTLSTLLEKEDEEKIIIEKSIRKNVEELVLPYLERLKKCSLNNDQELIVDCLESSLKSITSPFFENLELKSLQLTPMEIQVADLVRQGKTNKEIADILCLSINTILTHRSKVRSKLGLKHKKMNLRSYLLSFKE